MHNLLFVGVGGQGVLLASDIMAEVAFRAGFDVKKSEVHGMSQRGGSVFSHLRFGERVYSPLIPQGEADFLISFEEMETLRWTRFTRRDTVVILNRLQIPPMSVTRGEAAYPQDVIGLLQNTYHEVLPIDARRVTEALGQSRTANTVILGCLAVHLAFPRELWREVVRELVPPHTVEVNLRAFEEGWALAEEARK
jgi:indolepyruvate ferredoxin oxidoreductase beta subunit